MYYGSHSAALGWPRIPDQSRKSYFFSKPAEPLRKREKGALEPHQILGFLAVSSGIDLRIRGHPTGPPSAQALIMISPPSTQEEGTISRRLEHKSFVSKPLESKTRFIALSD